MLWNHIHKFSQVSSRETRQVLAQWSWVTLIVWLLNLWLFLCSSRSFHASFPIKQFLPQGCSGSFDLDQFLLWLVATWQTGLTGQKTSWLFQTNLEFAGSFIHKTGEAEWVENWDRYLLIVPLSLCSIPSANVYSPFMFLSRSPWGESAWVPQPQWVGGREEVQRVQNEELDPPGAPSYRLTCPNLTLLINIMPVSSPMQCDCDGQAKQGNSKYD